MQILDLSQIMISGIFGSHREVDCNIDDMREMMTSMIRNLNFQFRLKYGTMVLAADGKGPYWRHEKFPYYKGNRKKTREDSNIDWNTIHAVMNQYKSELKDYFPYKLIEVEGVEADDIIATLTKFSDEEVIILSADKDFIQLHNQKVKQYDPIRDKFIEHENPQEYLEMHIINGDRGDGIPNVLSEDDTFMVEGKRQKAMTANRIQEIKESWITGNYVDHFDKYMRNVNLIDLSKIPIEVEEKILDMYGSLKPPNKMVLRKYLIKTNMFKSLNRLGEF